jgi:hypothetical protein
MKQFSAKYKVTRPGCQAKSKAKSREVRAESGEAFTLKKKLDKGEG